MLCYFLLFCGLIHAGFTDKFDEDQYGVKYADECEVCKLVSHEFVTLLEESSKKHVTIETGYSFDKAKKKTKYAKSELRLIETIDIICDKLLEYNVHKERKDSTRFARGTSQTFQALDNLVAKGVKVDLGIPKELWHKPSAEVTNLKTQCETLLENHEEDIEKWYFDHQDKYNLQDFLCRQRMLKGKSKKCLTEPMDILNKKLKKKGDDEL
jgi:hypothetical protein